MTPRGCVVCLALSLPDRELAAMFVLAAADQCTIGTLRARMCARHCAVDAQRRAKEDAVPPVPR